MRDLHFWLDRANNVLLGGPNSSNPLTSLEVTKGDGINIFVHDMVVVPPPAIPTTPYVEQPLAFTAIRASIGPGADVAPNRGTFRFQVGDQTTAPLTWPDLTVTPLATWKAQCLAALIALSNVGVGGVVIADSPLTPVNFFYYTWTDPARTDVISVVSNDSIPLSNWSQEGPLTGVGYTQLVKIFQFPYALTTTFARPNLPAVTVGQIQAGGAGVSAEQLISIPAGAGGSVAFIWSGAQTASIDLATVTAAAVGTALNAIVANGASNPSFSLTDVSTAAGTFYNLLFTGPLANAVQPVLGVVMLNQTGQPYAQGTLDLTVSGTAVAIDQALNGQESVVLSFELVVVEIEDETFQFPITVNNKATTAETFSEISAAGAVSTITQTIVVDNSTAEPYASAAPGAAMSPLTIVAAGTAETFNHNLNTLNPDVRVQYQVSLSPPMWRDLQLGGEFTSESIDANNVNVTLVYALTGTSTDQYYYGRFKVFITSPDAVLQIFGDVQVTWDQCVQSIPSGQTLTAKLASIEAALGMVGGSLTIPAGNITGTIGANQIDINGVGTALGSSGTFLSTLQTLVSNTNIVKAIAIALGGSTDFVTTLTNIFNSASNTSLLNALATVLLANNTFVQTLQQLIVAIIQNGASSLTNQITFTLRTINLTYPALNADGSQPFLPGAYTGATSLGSYGNSAGVNLPAPASAGSYYTISGIAYLRPNRARTFLDGQLVYSTGNQWFPALLDGSNIYCNDLEIELFTRRLDDGMLPPHSQFSGLWQFSSQMLNANCNGQWVLIMRRGVAVEGTGAPNLSSFTWTETVINADLLITDVETIFQFGYTLTRGADAGGSPTLTASSQLGLQVTPDVAGSLSVNMVLQAVLTHASFYTGTSAPPTGQIQLNMKSQVASIVPTSN